jgi:hypothetical protein
VERLERFERLWAWMAVSVAAIPAILLLLAASGVVLDGNELDLIAACLGAVTIGLGAYLIAARQAATEASTVSRQTHDAVAHFGGSVEDSSIALRAITEEMESLSHTLAGSLGELHRMSVPSADDVVVRRSAIGHWDLSLRDRKNVRVTAMSMRRLASDHGSDFDRILRNGGTCQFLLLEPTSPACDIVAAFLQPGGPMDRELYESQVRASLHSLNRLKEAFPEQVHIRVSPLIPSMSLTLFDPEDDDHGRIIVELYTLDPDGSQRPHLPLTRAASPVWYDYFNRQFDALWSTGHEWVKPKPTGRVGRA